MNFKVKNLCFVACFLVYNLSLSLSLSVWVHHPFLCNKTLKRISSLNFEQFPFFCCSLELTKNTVFLFFFLDWVNTTYMHVHKHHSFFYFSFSGTPTWMFTNITLFFFFNKTTRSQTSLCFLVSTKPHVHKHHTVVFFHRTTPSQTSLWFFFSHKTACSQTSLCFLFLFWGGSTACMFSNRLHCFFFLFVFLKRGGCKDCCHSQLIEEKYIAMMKFNMVFTLQQLLFIN